MQIQLLLQTIFRVSSFIRAARLGFEPRYSDSESEVLPLDDLAMVVLYLIVSRNGGQCPTASEARQRMNVCVYSFRASAAESP